MFKNIAQRFIWLLLAITILNVSVDTDHLGVRLTASGDDVDDKDDLIELIVEAIADDNDIFNERNDGGHDDESGQSQSPSKQIVDGLSPFQFSKSILNSQQGVECFVYSYPVSDNFCMQNVFFDVPTPPPDFLS